MTLLCKVRAGSAWPLLSLQYLARKDETLTMARIVLFVSYVEYKLQGAMFMFKSHEAYQFYFDDFPEKEL